MATLQNLYNNIKTLITKYFEEKTIEDKTLPQWVELYFDYNNQGELSINDAPNTQNTLKFTFEGTALSQHSNGSFSGSNMFIDYGDGTIEKTTGKFGHTYDENGTYTVKIYGVTSLRSGCFFGCTGLTSITLPDSVSSLGVSCFRGCTGLTSITLPDSVSSLGDACFRGCTGLTSINIPSSVTTIGTNCFRECTGLTSINISSVTSLGDSCFRSCTGLTSITLSDSLTSIGYYCFQGCTGLTEIILQWDNSSEIISYDISWIDGCTLFDHFLIPEGTTQLYINAGYPSELLKEEVSTVVSLISDKSVSSYVYGESVVLTATAIDEGLPASGETVTFYQGETVLGTETTGDDGKASFTVTGLSVGHYSFTAGFDIYTSNTVKVTINKLESTITLVTDKSVMATGETYTLSGVLSVGSGESVKIYNGNTLVDTVTTGTGGAFTKTITATGVGVTNTYHAVFEATSIYNEATSSNVTIDVLSDDIMNLTVTGSSFSTYSSSPFTYTGRVFVDWGDYTGLVEYAGGKLVHSYSVSDTYTVKIYGNITSLEANCFERCTGLTSITLPSSVTSLGNACFYQCSGLTQITLPSSVTSIGYQCFDGCTGLTSITLPNSVTSLGNYCFQGCTGLTSINIPSSVTSIGSNCFRNCTGLTSIEIPSSVISLGNSCFSYCTGLTSITLPDSVTSLGSYFFYECTGLTSITLPDSVTSLGNYCFAGCTGLTSIILEWDTSTEILTYNSMWISNTSSNLKFSIPNGTTSLYTAKGYPSDKLIEEYIPIVDSVSLTSDKSILSYADNDSTTLTATHGLGAGKTVNLYNASDDTLIGVMTDNEDGTYSYTYNSQGIGDLTVYAGDGSITSEDMLIEDCLLYKPTLPTGDSVPINISNITIPTNFKAIFNVKQLRNTNSMGGLYIGSNSTNRILFGKIGSNGFVGIYIYKNGSTVASIHQENVYRNNEVSETVYTYNDGVQTITANGVTKQITNSLITDRNYLISNITNGGTEITELKIKPLSGTKYSSTEEPTDELSSSEIDP